MACTITADHLKAIATNTSKLIPGLAEWINKICPTYKIDSPEEHAHFLTPACHETDHSGMLKEYATGGAYEGRTDIGNKNPGDGVKYKGCGIFKTTAATSMCD